MRPILRLLTYCYPRDWRERYGAEMEYLIDSCEPRWRDCADLLQGAIRMRFHDRASSWTTAFALMLLGAVLGGGAAMLMPKTYISHAIIEAPAGTVSREPFAAAFDRKALTGVIDEQNLYASERARQPLEEVVHEMQKRIRITSVARGASQNGTQLMELAFAHRDAQVAQRVNKVLTARLIEVWSQAVPSTNGGALRLIDPPDLPSGPAHPGIPNAIGVGAIAGLVAGVVIVLIARLANKGRRPALPPSAAA